MDKDHLTRLVAAGILQEMIREAVDIMREAAVEDKMTFDPEEWELMEASAGVGAAAAMNWLYRNQILKDPIVAS